MPRDRDRVRLLHMLEHAREAMQLVDERTRRDLDTDRVLSLASSGFSRSWVRLRQECRRPHKPDVQRSRGRKSSV